MSDAPERIAFRWEVGAAITSGPLMNHPDYVHYVRADRIEELAAKLAKAVEALVMIADGPSEMVWGVDSEVREKMREMESIAGLTLAELKGQNDD